MPDLSVWGVKNPLVSERDCTGDTDETDEAAAVGCDLAFIPIGGTYTMTPAEAASLIRRMKPAAVIPTHYGSLVGKPGDGKTFASLVGGASTVILRLG